MNKKRKDAAIDALACGITPVAYCEYHRCYIDAAHVERKTCRQRSCKYFKRLKENEWESFVYQRQLQKAMRAEHKAKGRKLTYEEMEALKLKLKDDRRNNKWKTEK